MTIISEAMIWSVTYDCKWWCYLRLKLARIVNYNCNSSFIVLAPVITIVKYDRKILIVQATEATKASAAKEKNVFNIWTCWMAVMTESESSIFEVKLDGGEPKLCWVRCYSTFLATRLFVENHLADTHWAERHLFGRHLANRYSLDRHLVSRNFADISLWDISPWDISPWDISPWDISPWDISPWDISPWDI